MASLCPRCRRGHSGVCGVPAGVSLGFGARLGASRDKGTSFPIKGKPRVASLSQERLQGFLLWGEREYGKVLALLKTWPANTSEYAMLLDREGKLAGVIAQVKRQLAHKGG